METARFHLPDLFPFWSPDTPDLGCFIQRKHGLESYNFHVYGEPSPWRIVNDTLTFIDHQTYFRVKCGHAGHHQRSLVYMRGATAGIQDVIGASPDWVLGGNFLPYPSDWLKYPPQTEGHMYFFAGEHRSPSSTTWQWDEAVGHTYDIYDNGTLSTVRWDDTGGDRDFDDFVVEVAVVRRRLDLVVAQSDAKKVTRFTKEIEPKLERPDRKFEGE